MESELKMEDRYYSKKLDQYFSTRLDVLIYAHDGRGLGHASRSIGIGMALRRLYPDLKVLFVTGAAISQSLIGRSGLDWVKLPSYASKIENGVSTGVDGPANFYKSVLGHHRSQMLAQIVASFKPKCVLVDHSPLGKREELLPALDASIEIDTKWVLGLRAIIGDPKNFWVQKTQKIFKRHYHSIFWYGDKEVLGLDQVNRIHDHFGQTPEETGYVSRLYETRQLLKGSESKITGTISLPWLSRKSWAFIEQLGRAMAKRDASENWYVFIHQNDYLRLKEHFSGVPHIHVEPVGEGYAQKILSSRIAVIYGGYNSLMDVAAAGTPAIVVMREMQDKEQDEHIGKLLNHSPNTMIMVEESQADERLLDDAFGKLLERDVQNTGYNIKGSANAAKALVSLL